MNSVITAHVEVSKGSNVKYEIKNGNVWVDRVLPTPVNYFFNYGYVPGTLSDDGDALDVVILTEVAFVPMSFVECRVIGVLLTTDEKGDDDKLICVPIKDFTQADVYCLDYLPRVVMGQLTHFFHTYKNLEPDKWVIVKGLGNVPEALQVLQNAISRYNTSPNHSSAKQLS